MKRYIFILVVASFAYPVVAQEEDTPSPISVSGYLETYYIYDFNKPNDNTSDSFIYSFNRNNEVNLNIGMLKASYNTNNVRGNLALMAGTYTNANLATEPGVLKNIYEANIGLKLSARKNLWIDAGIFSSHIGFESAIGKDCWTLTRSIMADNTPYYEAGAKVSYTSGNGKWFVSGLILNGWQRIQRVNGNSLPSFGTQLTFKPSATITLNSSTFIGTDKPDSARVMRYFHNFYGIIQVSKIVGITVSFDYGAEEKSPDERSMNTWYASAWIVQYSATDKVAFALRGEYYSDAKGIIITTTSVHGFKTSGCSLNIDYNVYKNILWRTEVRYLASKDAVFERTDTSVTNNAFAGTSLCLSF